MQPRRDFCFATKPAQIPRRGEKSLLSRVAGVLFAPEHAKRQRKNAPLPATHNLTERLWVARQRAFNHLLVVGGRFHLVCARVSSGHPNVARNTSRSQPFRRLPPSASLQKTVMFAGIQPSKPVNPS